MAKKKFEEIKPIEVGFEDKLRDDKVFLLSLINDPVMTFRAYGFKGDEKMMSMLNGMATNVRERAIKIFTEIIGRESISNACNACNGCC